MRCGPGAWATLTGSRGARQPGSASTSAPPARSRATNQRGSTARPSPSSAARERVGGVQRGGLPERCAGRERRDAGDRAAEHGGTCAPARRRARGEEGAGEVADGVARVQPPGLGPGPAEVGARVRQQQRVGEARDAEPDRGRGRERQDESERGAEPTGRGGGVGHVRAAGPARRARHPPPRAAPGAGAPPAARLPAERQGTGAAARARRDALVVRAVRARRALGAAPRHSSGRGRRGAPRDGRRSHGRRERGRGRGGRVLTGTSSRANRDDGIRDIGAVSKPRRGHLQQRDGCGSSGRFYPIRSDSCAWHRWPRRRAPRSGVAPTAPPPPAFRRARSAST